MPKLHPLPNTGSLRLLARLPYDVQEDITEYLSRSDLYSLSLANKYLSNLAARALYSNVLLHSGHPYPKSSRADLRPNDTLRMRQFSFLIAIYEHPEYANFIRHIAFEFTDNIEPHPTLDYRVPEELVWQVFAQCKGVTSIDITMSNGHESKPPLTPLFPNLKHAKISGTFPESTLDRMLHTSKHLRSLHITAGTSEYIDAPGEWPSWSSSLTPFLDRSIYYGKFSSLRMLNFEAHQCSKPNITVDCLGAFLKHVTPHLEELTLSITSKRVDTDCWNEWDIDDTLCAERREELVSLCLKGKVNVSPQRARELKRTFPKLADVQLCDTSKCSKLRL